MAIHPLWQQYPTIEKELAETQKTMLHTVKIRNKEISDVLQIFLAGGGKLLRPAFFLLFTHFGEVPSDKQKYQYAAALEILHAATLIHDDIIDESPLRRSLPSIQKTYGKDIAVYTGDFLFTIYFQLLIQATRDYKALDFNAQNMKRILIGELDQMHLRNNPAITIKQYLRHIKGKTAQLFQLSCVEGARFANTSKDIQLRALRIGYNIGMAFQILDDILDFEATEEKLKKPVLEDLKNGNYTLPLIFAMEKNRADFKILEKKQALTDEDISSIVEKVHMYDGITKSQALAERYTTNALKEIGKLPKIPEQKILETITKSLLRRND